MAWILAVRFPTTAKLFWIARDAVSDPCLTDYKPYVWRFDTEAEAEAVADKCEPRYEVRPEVVEVVYHEFTAV